MYYVGDRAHTNKKLRPRFTGPFTIVDIISPNAVKILNDDTHETMICHVKMLKIYHKSYFTPENQYRLTLQHKQKLDKFSKQTPLHKRRQEKSRNGKKKKQLQQQHHHSHKSEDDMNYESLREDLFDNS